MVIPKWDACLCALVCVCVFCFFSDCGCVCVYVWHDALIWTRAESESSSFVGFHVVCLLPLFLPFLSFFSCFFLCFWWTNTVSFCCLSDVWVCVCMCVLYGMTVTHFFHSVLYLCHLFSILYCFYVKREDGVELMWTWIYLILSWTDFVLLGSPWKFVLPDLHL